MYVALRLLAEDVPILTAAHYGQIGSSSRPTVPDDISTEAHDFLDQTFEIDHEDRPAATELLLHPFIRESDGWTAAAQQTPTRATFSEDATVAARS